jgi:hypothetical protein
MPRWVMPSRATASMTAVCIAGVADALGGKRVVRVGVAMLTSSKMGSSVATAPASATVDRTKCT